MPKKLTPMERKVQELARRWQQADNTTRRQSIDQIPAKKTSKPVGYKMQNTFEKNLASVPGGSRNGAVSLLKQMQAASTGTKLGPEIGVLRSARNANTTQGGYNRSVVRDEVGRKVSDAQGRKEFGR